MRFTPRWWLALALVIAGLAGLAPAASAASSTGQSLAFLVQPSKSVVGQVITGSELNPSGPPIQVEILNSDGSLDTTSSAPVTIALEPNPAGGKLSGTTTVNAVNGMATFSNLSIDKAGLGYVLLATSPEIASAASRSFDVVDSGTRCTSSAPCTTSTSTQTSSFNLSSPATAGTLSISFDVGTALVCAGYTAQDANWFSYLSTSTSTGKTVVYTVRPSFVVPELVGNTQFCFGSPSPFEQRGGGSAPAGTLPDGSSGFIGLVPNCFSTSKGVCISGRSTTPDAMSPTGFDVVLTVRFPAGITGDPWGRA
jgi:hypothetical protein